MLNSSSGIASVYMYVCSCQVRDLSAHCKMDFIDGMHSKKNEKKRKKKMEEISMALITVLYMNTNICIQFGF